MSTGKYVFIFNKIEIKLITKIDLLSPLIAFSIDRNKI